MVFWGEKGMIVSMQVFKIFLHIEMDSFSNFFRKFDAVRSKNAAFYHLKILCSFIQKFGIKMHISDINFGK